VSVGPASTGASPSPLGILARARELERAGADIVHFEVGEPETPTPDHVVEAGIAALRDGQTRYVQAAGLPALREAAAAYLSATRGLPFDPANVLVGAGAKPFIFFGILALCGRGDEVVYPDPGFPTFEMAIRFAGATPVPLPLRAERDFVFDPAELEARLGPRTRLVLLNHPHNPTGAVAPADALAAAAELVARTSAYVLSDEVYARHVYVGACPTIAAEPGMLERTIVVDSCSKSFSMTGWRCGFAACPPALVGRLTELLSNSTSCVPPFVQHAAIAALTGPLPSVAALAARYGPRRRAMVDGLNAIEGVSCLPPDGALYVFPSVRDLPLRAEELATRLLEEAGVAVLPGTLFGRNGDGHLRLSYALPERDLERGLRRIADFVASL
jgi:aspartate/methionine/tyrosine aminotransferase